MKKIIALLLLLTTLYNGYSQPSYALPPNTCENSVIYSKWTETGSGFYIDGAAPDFDEVHTKTYHVELFTDAGYTNPLSVTNRDMALVNYQENCPTCDQYFNGNPSIPIYKTMYYKYQDALNLGFIENPLISVSGTSFDYTVIVRKDNYIGNTFQGTFFYGVELYQNCNVLTLPLHIKSFNASKNGKCSYTINWELGDESELKELKLLGSANNTIKVLFESRSISDYKKVILQDDNKYDLIWLEINSILGNRIVSKYIKLSVCEGGSTSLRPVSGGISIKNNYRELKNYDITVFSTVGQLLYRKTTSVNSLSDVIINIPQKNNVILIRVQTGNEILSIKSVL